MQNQPKTYSIGQIAKASNTHHTQVQRKALKLFPDKYVWGSKTEFTSEEAYSIIHDMGINEFIVPLDSLKYTHLDRAPKSRGRVEQNPGTFYFGGKEVRIITLEGIPWFVAKDVCEILEIQNNSQAVESLDEDEKLTYTMYISGQNRPVKIINESGLYSLVLTSRKPEAKSFKKWVTSEVLPSIRKTGSYSKDENKKGIREDQYVKVQQVLSLVKDMDKNVTVHFHFK